MLIVRRLGAATLAIAAVAVWFLMAPEEAHPPVVQAQQGVTDRSAEIARALSTADLNEITANSAPQQQVVNGWAAKDLLAILAEQQNEALTRDEVPPPVPPVTPNDERIPALAGLLVLGLALGLITARPQAVTDGRRERTA